MNSHFLNSVLNDLKRSWGAWAIVSVTSSVSWLALLAYVDRTRTIPSRGAEGIIFSFLGLFCTSIVTGIVALARKGTSNIAKTVVLLLLSVSAALGLPIILLGLIWIPILLTGGWIRGLALDTIGFLPIWALFWLVVGAVGVACFTLMSRSKKDRTDARA